MNTAPDLIAAMNTSLTLFGFAEAPTQAVKPFISHGVEAMLRHSIAQPIEADLLDNLVSATLEHYEYNIANESTLFSGMADTLENIEAKNLKWGVITNKRERFTLPLMNALKLTDRAACIISGDTTANSKPHPEPMRKGCQMAQVLSEECVYIGDARHDITAGQAVNMKTLVATYGYLQPDDQPELWGADALVDSPFQINTWIDAALCH